MSHSFVVLLTIGLRTCNPYIVPSGQEAACPTSHCENNGELDKETCTCVCLDGFTGFFCEHESLKSAWPYGDYALPMSSYGCPEAEVYQWETGYLNLTLDKNAKAQAWNDANLMTFEPYLMGPYHTHSFQLNFCVRRSGADPWILDRSDWPAGHYCIYRVGQQCPAGFSEGSITMAGYFFRESDVSGILPAMETGNSSGLTLFHCCRSDSIGDEEVKFPDSFPFLLLSSHVRHICPTIDGMVSQMDFFNMTDSTNEWLFSGYHSYVDNSTTGHVQFHYCHYIPKHHRECYFADDLGASYKGRVNVSQSGRPCMFWLGLNDTGLENGRIWHGELDQNFCNTIDIIPQEGKPFCFVDTDFTREACDLPLCVDETPLQTIGKHKPLFTHIFLKEFDPFHAVDGIYGQRSFANQRPQNKPYLQLDIQEWFQVHRISVYRINTWFPVNFRLIGTYVSKHQWDFIDYGALRCDDIRYPNGSMKFIFECRRPIIGQYVTLRNFDTTDPVHNYGKFFILSVNEIRIIGKHIPCGKRLGMTSGDIFDYQLEISSKTSTHTDVNDGRLGQPGKGWCPHTSDMDPWYLVDLIVPTVVQGILVQGWDEGATRVLVSEFILAHGISRDHMSIYQDPPLVTRVFRTLDYLKSTAIQRFILKEEILARYLKIQPTKKEWNHACLKLEFIGCPKRINRDIPCRPGTLDYGFEEQQYHSWWLDETGRLDKLLHKNVTAKQCRQLVKDGGHVSYSLTRQGTTREDCMLHDGHRYETEWASAWITNVADSYFAGQRLCIQGIDQMQSCGGEVWVEGNNEVVIRSPSFPFSYGQGITCSWTLRSLPRTFIHLRVVETNFAPPVMWNEVVVSEDNFASEDIVVCEDELIIAGDDDRENTRNKLTYTTADTFRGSIIISSSDMLTVQFKSCFLYAPNNFRFFELRAKEIAHGGCGMELGHCFQTCTAMTGYIATERYPAGIFQTEACTWKIEGAFGQYVSLEILQLDIALNGSCVGTFVSVYDISLSNQLSLMASMCKYNRTYNTFSSGWHKMQVEFRTFGGSGNGFLGFYRLLEFTQESFPEISSDGCPDVGWQKFRDSCYRFERGTNNDTDVATTWIDARKRCQQYPGGHLVSINSKDEMAFLHFMMTKVWIVSATSDAYIGLHKVVRDGSIRDYVWDDGRPLTYTAWYKGERSQPDGLTGEQCSAIRLYSIHTIDNWHDIACAYDRIYNFICETSMDVNISETFRNSSRHFDDDVSSSRMQPTSLSISNESSETLFMCRNGELIARAYFCDKRQDCTDNSDEDADCDYCSLTQYRCADGHTCISLGRYCDFRKDCPDNSDEVNCVRTECSDDQMQCRNQQCVPKHFRCDMKVDCMDGSDEENCGECGERHFRCYDQSCMRRSRVCDGKIDCGGLFYEDENQACEQNTQRSCAEWWYLGIRDDGQYLTNMGTDHALPVTCKFLKKNGKDLVQTIVHHAQEEPITVTQGKTLNQHVTYTLPNDRIQKLKDENVCYQSISMKCHFTILRSTSWQGGFSNETKTFSLKTMDGRCSCPMFFNCDGNQTGCNCSTITHDWYTASTTEVRRDSGVVDDERYLPILQITAAVQTGQQRNLVLQVGPLICENDDEVQTERYLCRSKISISYTQKCLRDYDEYGELKGCQDLSHLDDCEHFACPPDYVKCPRRYCIPTRLVCDGTDHCPDGQDEHHCGDSCPGLYRCHASNVCIPRSSVCDGLQQCPNGDDETHCHNRCPDSCVCSGYTVTCLSVSPANGTIDVHPNTRKLKFILSDFSTLLPEFDFRLLGELNLSNSGITELKSRNFFLLKNLYSLDLSYNSISRIIASVFEGLANLRFLSLEGNVQLQHVYEDAFFGLSRLPEVVIVYTRITSLPMGTFKGLDSIQSLHITDNSLTKIEDDAFSSLSSLSVLDIRGNEIMEFSDGIFRGLSNLTKLYTDAYMFCCLKPAKVTEDNCLPYQDEFSSCDDLMREDMLRAFLWIIGLCGFFGNICVVMYKCIADKHTLKKAHGILITNLGISDFCMGVYMLIIAFADSAFRGRYVWNDLAWRYGNICKLAGVLATVSSEASVIFLLLITLDRFVTIKFPFGQVQFGPRKAKWACLGVWLFAVSVAVLPLVATGYFMGGFYSRSAVCLALPLTRDRPPGWEYGTTLFIFLNFVLFVGIAIGQIFIYKEISSDDKMLKSQRHFQDAAIARSLFLVVFSDFLCWFPVGVMGLMALSGKMIPGSTYAWTAVFILPINSALNPIIYTFTGILKKKKYQGLNFGRSLKKSPQDINAWKIWMSLSQNDLFMFGNHPTTYTPLSEVMTTEKPSVRGMYKVVLELIRGVVVLHDNDMVNGRLMEDNVLLAVQHKRITRVVIRLELAVQEVEKSDDISDVGKLTINLLRWYQKQIGNSKKKLSRLGAQ